MSAWSPGTIAVECPVTNYEALRRVSGVRWYSPLRRWLAPIEQAARVVAALGGEALVSVDEPVSMAMQAERHRLQVQADLRAGKDPITPMPTSLRKPLWPFQQRGVAFLEACGFRGALFDQMGLGKTLMAITVAERLRELGKAQRILIIIPASGRANWPKEVFDAAGQVPCVWYADGPYANPGAIYHIINYDVVYRHHRALEALGADLIILDECHRLRNPATRHTKSIFGDRWKSPQWPGLHSQYVVALTGTPVMFRPSDAAGLLHYIAPGRFPSVTDVKRMSQVHLHHRMQEIGIRRDDTGLGLPPQVRRDVLIPLVHRARYEAALDRLLNVWAARRPNAVEAQQLLLALVDEKLPRAYEMIDELLMCGRQVIVFSYYRRPVDAIKERYGARCGVINGDVKDRKAVERAFEDGTTPVVACTLGAGGEVLTFNAASVVIFLDQHWAPTGMRQAAKRAGRIGSTQSHIFIYTLLVEGTVDLVLRDALVETAARVDTMTDGTVIPWSDGLDVFGLFVAKVRATHKRALGGGRDDEA